MKTRNENDLFGQFKSQFASDMLGDSKKKAGDSRYKSQFAQELHNSSVPLSCSFSDNFDDNRYCFEDRSMGDNIEKVSLYTNNDNQAVINDRNCFAKLSRSTQQWTGVYMKIRQWTGNLAFK